MRGLRSFVGLLVILIALGAYLYFVESKRTPGDEGETRPKVFAVAADQIDEITVKAESGERTTLRKTGAEWQVAAPAASPADSSEVEGITRNLATLEEQRLIDENPGDLKEFGLAEPRLEVAFKAGGEEQRLLLGSKTPTGGDVYAKTAASPRVFLIASYVESTFNRGTFDLRDKTALRFDRDKVDAMDVTSGTSSIRFAKQNGEWRIVEPQVPRVDPAAIESLIARLDGAQIKKVVSADGAELKTFGLDRPAASVRINTGSSQAMLLLGSKSADGDVHAKDASRPEVFTLEGSLLEDVQRDAAQYRQTDLFDARAFNTGRVEIARAGQTLVFEKKDDKWHQTAPSAREPEAGKIEGLLSSLTSARADSFVAVAPQGATTEATVTLKFDEGRREERVTFLRAGADAFAVRSDSPGAAKIGTSVLDGILKSIDEAR